MKMFFVILMFLNYLVAQDLKPDSTNMIINLDKYYKSFTGSFVLLDLNTGCYKTYNDSISTQRYSPMSTFKITNSLIGLETSIIENADYLIKYDSLKNPSKPWMYKKEPFKYWMQDHTLKTAFKNSVVWYYQELARRVENENMIKLLKLIDYGNNDISSGIDNFWLYGSLKISAKEQVEFLKKLYRNQLFGFSIKNQEIVKDIMLYESTDRYKLYGKTGAGACLNNQVIGWYVGFVETNSNTYIFAMNIMVNNFSDLDDNLRVKLSKNILREFKIIQ